MNQKNNKAENTKIGLGAFVFIVGLLVGYSGLLAYSPLMILIGIGVATAGAYIFLGCGKIDWRDLGQLVNVGYCWLID